MKYILIPVFIILAFLYLIIERAIKAVVCLLVFLWNFSFNKKYYWFWDIVFIPTTGLGVFGFETKSKKEFFKSVKELSLSDL